VPKGKKWQKETFKEVPQVCPNKKKGTKKGQKEVPLSPCKKKFKKKKSLNEIPSSLAPQKKGQKKVPKQSLKFAQTRKESAPKKKLHIPSHPLFSALILSFEISPQFWGLYR
jgi:hypothetical protein